MGLSESKKKNLEDKDFDTLFTGNRPKWTRFAREAHRFARQNITGGNEPRPDDVAKALYAVIEADETFRDHQEENRARQPRYVGWFTDYVVDQVLVEPRRARA